MATRGGSKPSGPSAEIVPPPPVADLEKKPPEPPPVDVQKQPDPPPPVDKEPVAPQKVHIRIASTPAGAQVFVGDEASARGVTPMQLDLDKADGETAVTVRADGYKDASRPVKLSMDAQLDVAMVKDRRSSSSSSGSGSSGKSGSGSSSSGSGKSGKDPKQPSKPGSDDVLAPSF